MSNGLGMPPMNMRLPGPDEETPDLDSITVSDAELDPDMMKEDDKGNIIEIEHADGSITISLDDSPLIPGEGNQDDDGEWFGNLVDKIDPLELNAISNNLLRGIEEDLESRKEWIESRAQGLKLLGLKLEIPGISGAAEGAPVEGMSRVRHPLLLEAVLRFQANARSEMLPTDGPVKIRVDATDGDLETDQLANALEQDFNHYLTSTATEYYPDTDRMLLMLGFGGTSFKKVYYCPLRNRPVSETVDADDLVVNNGTIDLANARRITHRLTMRPSVVRRMQILGVYRDVSLGDAQPRNLDSFQREEKDQQGITDEASNPDDRDREIYECYCELDIKGFEHHYKGKPSGLEIPYVVTIDVSSKEILSIVRNYDQEDPDNLPEARTVFIKYTFVPGIGFYDIGLLHILGNTTNAITAAWRELLDAGMYSNFPGFLMADTGARQNTNIFRVPPGGGALVKTGGLPIKDAIMPLPYQPPNVAMMQLVDNMAQTGMRIGGTSELQVGEGRAEAPVGTTLALIEQATKVLNSVHKRMHASQAQEFQALKQRFREYPKSFWQRNNRPAEQWDEQRFIKALNNCNLIPQADPNTASHGQRIMKITALKQLQQQSPSMYDPIAVDTAALQAIGWNNPDQFLVPPTAQAAPPPELLEAQAKMETSKSDSAARMMVAQAKVAETQAKIQQGAFAPKPEGGLGAPAPQQPTPLELEELRIKQMDAVTRAESIKIKHRDALMHDQNRDLDRQSRERVQLLQLAKDILTHPEGVEGAQEGLGKLKREVEE
jgi:hypothetical protein